MEKRWTNVLGFVELMGKTTAEQPTINHIDIKNINTLTPYNKVLPTPKGNELNFSFIRCFFLLSLFFPFFVLILLFLFFCSNFCFFIGNKKH